MHRHYTQFAAYINVSSSRIRQKVVPWPMRTKYVLNLFLVSTLAFSFLISKYANIQLCRFCIISRMIFFAALFFSWMSMLRHVYIYASTILLMINFIFGNITLYFIINGAEPPWCSIGHNSCLEHNTILSLPMQFWIVFLSSIALILSIKAIKDKSSSCCR